MQAVIIQKRIESLPALSRSGKRINGLHRLLRSPYLYELAYAKISSNKGALTPGVDGATFDGMSLDKLANIARRIAGGRYRFRPVRRVHIPKANGKTRPLGIPTVEDRLVQEAVRIVLEAIYEPVFRDSSHGFRAGRSCHTALETIKNTWTGCKWLVEVDVAKFFDNINHDVLLRLLEQRIDDRRFIGLIEGMLKAGYMEDWVYGRTYSGTPQGGIVSPLLANVYLHELDVFMEEMRAGFDRGKRRRPLPRYVALETRIRRLRRKIDRLRASGADNAEIKALKLKIKANETERRGVPSVDPMDPDFKRLRYCRYADDFLIGIIGSKQEAREIMTSVQDFLADRLKLGVSPEKSGIHAASKGSIFLGYHVSTFTSLGAGRKTRWPGPDGKTWHTVRRPTAGNVSLRVPRKKVSAFCKRKGYGVLAEQNGRHRTQFLDSSDVEIVTAYNSEFRGFASYYAIAHDCKRALGLLELIVFRSLLKTLAMRHRSSLVKIRHALKKGEDYELSYVVQGEVRNLKLWRLKHLDLRPRQQPDVDNVTVGARLALSPNDLIDRLKAAQCEACGTRSGPFEMHHLRKLKDLRSEPLTIWKRSSRRRKTIVLCRTCHLAAHHGRQKTHRESRVH